MANHDYGCDQCGYRAVDVWRTAAEGATANPPLCCGVPMQWIPMIGRMDALEPGQEFTVYNGRNEPVLVESLAQMRKIERESEVHARNGEGQQMVWRKYSQDRSNNQVNTLGKDPQEAPNKASQRKFSQQRSASEPSVVFGPGVSEANASALKE